MPTRIGPKNPRRVYLRQWREYHDLTQQQVADRIGCTKYIISKWECGHRVPSLEAFAEAIGEPMEKLFILPPPKDPWASERTPQGVPRRSNATENELRNLIVELTAALRRQRR